MQLDTENDTNRMISIVSSVRECYARKDTGNEASTVSLYRA